MNVGLSLFRGEGLRAQLLRGGAGSVAVKIASVGLGLALAVILARNLGPRGYGVYSYVYALVALLSIPAQFGLPALVVRETAKAEANQQWGLMRGLWRWAGFCETTLALLLGFVSGSIAWFYADHFSALQLATFAWGLALIPFIAFGALRGASLSGLRKVVQGQLPEQVIRPALLVLFILCIAIFTRHTLQPNQAMALHVLAAAIAFAIGTLLLRRERPSEVATRPVCNYDSKRWLSSAMPLALVSGMVVINTQTDIVMLGFFTTAKDVGIYRIAALGSNLVAFGFSAVGAVTMPYFARLYVEGSMIRFQKLATLSARMGLLFAIPVALVFLIFGADILRLVFGPAYMSGYAVLAILTCAQMVNVGFGSIGPLLNMTGFERDTAKGIAVAAVCNVILNALMIPVFGMIGAALATGITLVVWNVILWVMVRRRLGVDSSALGLAHKFTVL